MLDSEIRKYVGAGFPGVWLETREPEDAVEEIHELCTREGFLLYQFNPKEGLQRATDTVADWTSVCEMQGKMAVPITDLPAALRRFVTSSTDATAGYEIYARKAAAGDPDDLPSMLLVIWHAHLYGEGFVDEFRKVLNFGRGNRVHLIFMSHVTKPLELLKPRMAYVTHALPTTAQLTTILHNVATQPDDIPSEAVLKATVAAAAGMTRIEAENAFSLSIDQHNVLRPDVIFQMKSQALKVGNKAVELFEGRLARVGDEVQMTPLTFNDVGGNFAVKNYLRRMLLTDRKPFLARARGVLLAGVPGTGKTLIAKAIGGEIGWPVLLFYPQRLRGGIQGMAESAMEEFIEKAKRMSPCVVCVDEAEQISIGVQSSGLTDGGVKAGLAKRFTQFLEECTAQVYFVLTCNNYPAILQATPEMVRSGRINRKFFFDYPRKEARAAIWKIQLVRYGLYQMYETTPEAIQAMNTKELYSFFKLPDKEENDKWTGAEIEGACEEADLTGDHLDKISVIPDSETNEEVIEATRRNANGKMFAAEYEGIYDSAKHEDRLLEVFSGSNVRRSLRRDKPSRN